MATLFIVTVLSCEQLFNIIARIESNTVLTPQQRSSIVSVLKGSVPSCPVVIKPDAKR